MIKGQLEPNLSERLSGIHVDKYGTINQQGLSYRDTYLISLQNNRDLQILYPYLIRSQQPHQFSNHTRTFHSRSLAIPVSVTATQNNTISSLDVLAASSKVMLMCFFYKLWQSFGSFPHPCKGGGHALKIMQEL